MKQILFLLPFLLLFSCKTHKLKQTETLQIREQIDSLYRQQTAVLHTVEWLSSLQEVHLTLEAFKDSTGHTQVQLHSTTHVKHLRERTDSLQQKEMHHLRQRTLHFHKRQSFKQKEQNFGLSQKIYWLIVLILIVIAYYQYKKYILKK